MFLAMAEWHSTNNLIILFEQEIDIGLFIANTYNKILLWKSHLDSVFRQIRFKWENLALIDVGIVCLFEGFLQLF